MQAEEQTRLWTWSEKVPAAIARCLHEMVEEQVRARPHAMAIHAWDGQLTYSELDDLATRLAHQLADLRVGPGVIVPLCFEKSMWATIALLAVLKAGAAFVMLEPAHPENRLQGIVQQTGATTILSSTQHFSLSSRLAEQVIPVGLGSIVDKSNRVLPLPNPLSTMYIAFTSGSTGVPKGSIISHIAFCSGVYYQASQLGFTAAARVLDFASYAFDLAVHSAAVTLATGGCLCVSPEVNQRGDITTSIVKTAATIVIATPSLAQLILPESTPSIQAIILGGEPSTIQDIERWWSYAKVANVYGPSECTPLSVINCGAPDPYAATRIGKGAGVVTWIVDPSNHDKLVPIGVVGELLLEGPLLGDGYLNDPEKTAAAFIKNPLWLLEGSTSHARRHAGRHAGRHGRLYKTGDLVRYHEDGSLIYVGRKDMQVKIRGQRVELGEVEHHVRKCMPQTRQVAAEVFTPAGEDISPMLAVFISSKTANADKVSVQTITTEVEDKLAEQLVSVQAITTKVEDKLAEQLVSVQAITTEVEDRLAEQLVSVQAITTKVEDKLAEQLVSVQAITTEVEDRLAKQLPSYMVPTICFVLDHLPMTTSDKIDRKRLRELGASYSAQQLADLRSQAKGNKRMPSTEVERTMQRLWGQILRIEHVSIGLDDNFFQLGGDSITAIKLVAEARRAGLQLSVADIFGQPTLSSLAIPTTSNCDIPQPSHIPQPFALITNQTLSDTMSNVCKVTTPESPLDIEDIFPTTRRQQDYLLLYKLHPTIALNYCSLYLGKNIDVNRFRDACTKLIDHCSILRTIFFPDISLSEQVVLRKLNSCFKLIQVTGDLESAIESVVLNDREQKLPPGCSFISFFLLCHESLGHHLIFRISHAQYDVISLPLIVQTLLDAYCNKPLIPSPPFSVYLAHAESQKLHSMVHWRKILRGSRNTPLNQNLSLDRQADLAPVRISVACSISTPELPWNLTLATLVSSAWALVLSSITGKDDVVYGMVVAGRNACIPEILEISGPCVNVVPVRARIRPDQSALDLLTAIHDQTLSIGQSDSAGLHDVIRECTDWPARIDLDSLIQHQGNDHILRFQFNNEWTRLKWFEHKDRIFPKLHVLSTLEQDQLELRIDGDSTILSPQMASAVLESLRKAVVYLSSKRENRLADWLGHCRDD